jgi:hypothetical protein
MIQRSIFLLLSVILGAFVGLVGAQTPDRCTPRNISVASWGRTNFCKASVDLNEIISGGPGKDGIPAIDNPRFESIAQAQTWLGEKAPVIVVAINGEARAYPQAILIWHEIVNDELGGVPIAVTYCPLCNSSIVFDRRVEDAVLSFGVSGLLRKSDMVMYDRQTDSWWQQFIGVGIVGDYTDTVLDVIPSQVVGFAQFAQKYPEGDVLTRDTGFSRAYGRNPYVGYDQTRRPFLFRDTLDPRLAPVAHVLAGVVGDVAIAYPFEALREVGVLNDVIAETPIVAFWQAGTASAMDAENIDSSRDIGTAAAYSPIVDGQTLTFRLGETGAIIDEQTASTWDVFGEATDGELTGTQLERLVFAPHFWFAWAAFQPQTVIYGQ